MIILLSLLTACLPGGSKLVGRWEQFSNDEHTTGFVYEFYDDGTSVAYEFLSATQLAFPAIVYSYEYRFSTGSGRLSMAGRRWGSTGTGNGSGGEGGLETRIFEVTFVTDDEIVVTPEDQADGLTFLRAPVPEMPLQARTTLGSKLRRQQQLSVVSVERLEGDWQDQYPDYVIAGSMHFIPIENPEQWVAVIQVEGEAEPRLYIAIEGESWWGVIQLEKQE
jgi:hypothetical protein